MSRTIQEHAHPATPKIQHRVETGVKGISLPNAFAAPGQQFVQICGGKLAPLAEKG